MSRTIVNNLQRIPGVGPSISKNLVDIGIHSIENLINQNAEDLYNRSNLQAGTVQDRCLLYVFRCAIFYAEGGRDPEKLKWWHWKD